jgi:Fe-Mn family superoxide dismutase
MDKNEKKIDLIKKKISESKKETEKKLIISEMKKIGIEKLPYSYSALKKFIDSETMSIHYNKHYKGYVDKLNAALQKRKGGDKDLEKIIKNISNYSQSIRNNAGGAFNHALFWNMLSPQTKKLEGELLKKINRDFGSLSEFKKKFEEIAKERFGSGWVWLVLTTQNKLKIMSTQNQDNPLMNVIKDGGFPLLGLDLWEHAYYLKYKNKRDEYISNFWEVVNWDFVSELFKMKTETSLLEQKDYQILMENIVRPEFCDPKEVIFFNEMINNYELKKTYGDGITKILKSVFSKYWVENPKNEMSGFYGVESQGARSVLNNLNTNFNTFCLLSKAVNKLIKNIGRQDRNFDFSKKENRNKQEIIRFLTAVDYFKKDIFTKRNEDFVNIIKVLLTLWNRGQKSENSVSKKIELFFGDDAKIQNVGGHGVRMDAQKGIDIIVIKDEKKFTGQIKPYSDILISDSNIIVKSSGNVKEYSTDWLIFFNPKTNKILIFKNNGKIVEGNYVLPQSSLLFEIE